jgi:hypothetical protein
MPFTTHPTVVPGDTWTAANQNTYVKGNLDALFVGLQQGDMDYYGSPTALARLVKPSVASVLTHNATIPSWLTKGAALSVLRVNAAGTGFEWASGVGGIKVASHFNDASHTYGSTVERDMPNSSNTIVLTATSTLVVMGRVLSLNAAGNCWTQAALMLDGTLGQWSNHNYGGEAVELVMFGVKTGVTAGTKTIKMREKEGYGSGLSYSVGHLEWVALAFPE